MRSPATPVSSIFSKDFFARPTRPDRVSGHPVSQSVSQSVGWSVGQPVGEPVSRHLGFSETHPKRCASFFFPIPVPLYLFPSTFLSSSYSCSSLSLSLSLSIFFSFSFSFPFPFPLLLLPPFISLISFAFSFLPIFLSRFLPLHFFLSSSSYLRLLPSSPPSSAYFFPNNPLFRRLRGQACATEVRAGHVAAPSTRYFGS